MTDLAQNLNQLQSLLLDGSSLVDNLLAVQQSLIRHDVITTEEQATQYLRDLGMEDVLELPTNAEKAFRFYDFYYFLNLQGQAEDYSPNLVKAFQLAVFYDDNYVYRYYLGLFLSRIGATALALDNLKDAALKLKNGQTQLYPELASQVSSVDVPSELTALLKSLLSTAVT